MSPGRFSISSLISSMNDEKSELLACLRTRFLMLISLSSKTYKELIFI